MGVTIDGTPIEVIEAQIGSILDKAVMVEDRRAAKSTYDSKTLLTFGLEKKGDTVEAVFYSAKPSESKLEQDRIPVSDKKDIISYIQKSVFVLNGNMYSYYRDESIALSFNGTTLVNNNKHTFDAMKEAFEVPMRVAGFKPLSETEIDALNQKHTATSDRQDSFTEFYKTVNSLSKEDIEIVLSAKNRNDNALLHNAPTHFVVGWSDREPFDSMTCEFIYLEDETKIPQDKISAELPVLLKSEDNEHIVMFSNSLETMHSFFENMKDRDLKENAFRFFNSAIQVGYEGFACQKMDIENKDGSIFVPMSYLKTYCMNPHSEYESKETNNIMQQEVSNVREALETLPKGKEKHINDFAFATCDDYYGITLYRCAGADVRKLENGKEDWVQVKLEDKDWRISISDLIEENGCTLKYSNCTSQKQLFCDEVKSHIYWNNIEIPNKKELLSANKISLKRPAPTQDKDKGNDGNEL